MSENNNSKQEEIFKRCPKNQSLLVGNLGTIKNYFTKKVLKQFLIKGYFMVENPKLTFINPREYESVHRLVALTYDLQNYTQENWLCHHKDKNKLNNLPENLQWVSHDKHNKIHGYYPTKIAA